jgi:microcin C transport system permease protein
VGLHPQAPVADDSHAVWHLLLTFVVIQFVPGGPVEQMVAQLQGRDTGGEGAAAAGAGYRGRQGVDAQRIEEIRQLYGFDKPAHERFFQMLGQFARFDLGQSFFHHKDVWELVKEKLPVSISLGLWTFFLSYLISVPLGIAKAVRAGTRFDTVTSLVVLVGYAIPGFVLGWPCWWCLAGSCSGSPCAGSRRATGKSSAWAPRWWTTCGTSPCRSRPACWGLRGHHHADQKRLSRRDTQAVRADRPRQGPERAAVLWKHVFRNALIPIVTGFPAAFIGAFFAGSLLIETLFSLDGLGLLSYESVMRRDYPVVLGTLYLFTLIGW